MFNSLHGEALRRYREWVASGFRTPAVPDRVRDYLVHLSVESPAGRKTTSGARG